MCSIVVLFAQRLQASCNLLLALHMEGVAEEFTALLLEDSLGITLDCKVAISYVLIGVLHDKSLFYFVKQSAPADILREGFFVVQ